MTFIKLGAGETAMHACVGGMAARAFALGAEWSPASNAADLVSGAASDLVSSALGVLESAGRLLE